MSRIRKGRARERQYLINALNKAADKIEHMCEEKPKKVIDDLNDEALSIITRWYSSYPNPKFYKRQGGLKHAYKILQDDLNISLEMEPEFMSEETYHQSTEIIFYNSFMQGFHGGSIGTDKLNHSVSEPTWRSPYKFYSHWGDQAPQSESPYDQIYEYSTKRLERYTNEWGRDLKKCIDLVERSYKGYMRK